MADREAGAGVVRGCGRVSRTGRTCLPLSAGSSVDVEERQRIGQKHPILAEPQRMQDPVSHRAARGAVEPARRSALPHSGSHPTAPAALRYLLDFVLAGPKRPRLLRYFQCRDALLWTAPADVQRGGIGPEQENLGRAGAPGLA